MRPEMVIGELRLGLGGSEAVMVMSGGSACSLASQASSRSIQLRPSWTARLAHNRVIKSVNRPFLFVLRAWDGGVPHQTHPQSPIHTSLNPFTRVPG